MFRVARGEDFKDRQIALGKSPHEL